jgi:peptide/nickel transport system substrate-binding protein
MIRREPEESMGRLWSRVIAGVACVASVVALAACGSSGGGSGSGGSDTLKISANVVPDTMDPHNSVGVSDSTTLFALFDTLIKANPDLSLSPGLATEWTWSPDFLVLDLTIREGVSFQDGTPLDAEAVAWNLNRQIDGRTQLRGARLLSAVKSVEVTGPFKVRLTLSQPNVSLLYTLADRQGMMMSPTATKADPSSTPTKPVGTGAFKLTNWVRGSSVTLSRNDQYWGVKSSFATVVQRSVIDNPSRRTDLATGQADIVDVLDTADALALQKQDGITVESGPGPQYDMVAINVQKAPWNDKRVRQALAYAIDRQALADVVYQGHADVSNGPFTKAFTWIYPNLPQPVYGKQDIEKAKQLLAEAGYPNGVSLTTTIPIGTVTLLSEMELIKQQVAPAGITININPVDVNRFLAESAQRTFQGLGAINTGVLEEPNRQVYDQFITGGGLNNSVFSNPDVDRLLNEAIATDDQAVRSAKYAELTTVLLDESPRVFLVAPERYRAWRADLNGVQSFSDWSIRNMNLITER